MYGKKQLCIRILFFIEIVLFVYGYGWGRHGIISLYAYKRANENLLKQLVEEQNVMQSMINQIVAWNSDPFYKEQYARELLHMARADEIIYM